MTESAQPSFSTLPLSAATLANLQQLGYRVMTPIQAASLPLALAGHDLIAQAQTGSGKTAAFALALLAKLNPRLIAGVAPTQALVLCPTRELADQVTQEIRRLARAEDNIKALTLCGGVPIRSQLDSLAHGAHIVVGTPGRIVDHLDRGTLPLGALQTLVLDEADRMLDMGFADDLYEILDAVPPSRQTLLFSATLPPLVREISRRIQPEALEVIVPDAAVASTIRQRFFEVAPELKLDGLIGLLQQHRPESTVVFCNTRHAVREVAEALRAKHFAAIALHGELDQRERDELLVAFSNRSASVLVASDVAARGLDIADLTAVINFDLANDADTHLHRVGRTGRAGKPGLALSLCVAAETARAGAYTRAQGVNLVWRKCAPAGPGKPPPAPNRTLIVDAGRQDKVRPADLLGALTGEAGLPATAIGKIDIFPTRSYVAIARDLLPQALAKLRAGKIKGRNFRVRTLEPNK